MKKIPWFVRLTGWAIIGLLFAAQSSLAREISLEWDPNLESDLAGYRLYQSTSSLIDKTPAQAILQSGIITSVINAGTNSCTVSGLELNKPYFFRLTAYNASQESAFNVDASGQPYQVMVYLQDNEGRAAQKFLTPGVADGINDEAQFGPETKEVTILNQHGRKVFHAARSDGSGILVWRGRDDQGKLLPSGVYIAKIARQDGSTVYQNFVIVK